MKIDDLKYEIELDYNFNRKNDTLTIEQEKLGLKIVIDDFMGLIADLIAIHGIIFYHKQLLEIIDKEIKDKLNSTDNDVANVTSIVVLRDDTGKIIVRTYH